MTLASEVDFPTAHTEGTIRTTTVWISSFRPGQTYSARDPQQLGSVLLVVRLAGQRAIIAHL